jgi:amidophosphoribosyltransferase
MDTSDRSTLIAAQMEVDEVRQHVGADSLGYLSLAGLRSATGVDDGGFCNACLSGEYPTDISGAAGKNSLEKAEALNTPGG